MLNHIIIAALCLIVFVSNGKQPSTKKPTTTQPVAKPVPVRFPGVFVNDENGVSKPLHIRQLTANVHVRGTLATTTFEMVVYNPHSRVLEGEFSFPVADGQTVSRFALDINGKMREAVVVDKTKGRQTFEEVIRTKIDPALLEWTRDNSFRARIYPINPQGTRRIIIAYEQQLSKIEDGFGYTIPFAFPERIDTFSFHADVAAFGTRPSLAGDGGDVIAFTPHGRTFIADMYRENILLDKPFSLQVPVALRNNIVSINSFGEEQFAGVFLTTPPVSRRRALPKSISIVWDASLSRLKSDQAKEKEFLSELFKVIKDVSIDFSVFSNDVIKRSSYSVVAGDWTSLRNAIETLKYDGGTQLSVAPLNNPRSEMILLMSDGISTFGEHQPVLGKTPVFTVCSGAQADHALLHSISNRTGGAFIDLLARGMQDAIASVLEEKLKIREVLVLNGQLDDIRPQGAIEIQEVTTITGKLRSSSAHLRFIMSGAIDEEFTAVDVYIDGISQRDEGTSMARLWAQHELQRLSTDRNKNAETIKALGTNFGIVTPGTSLIVLERIEDYVRFNIEPPQSEPALVSEWKARRSGMETDSLAKIKQHKEYVHTLAKTEKERIDKRRKADSIAAVASRLPKAKILGSVVDTNGKIINGAHITIDQNGNWLDTTQFGKFELLNITPGKLDVTVIAPGYFQYNTTLEVAPGSTNTQQFKLIKDNSRPRKFRATSNGRAEEELDARAVSFGDTVGGFPVVSAPIDDRSNDAVRFSGRRSEKRATIDFFESNVATTVTSNDDAWSSPSVATADATSDVSVERDIDAIVVAAPQSRSLWTDELNKVSATKLYEWYLGKRIKFFNEASFYLDVADKLIDAKRNAEALRVLSSLAELHGEDSRTLRILAHRLLQIGQTKLAVMVFRDVKNVREEEPQAWRDLGLALTADGQYQEASTMFLYMIEHEWHSRFPEVELIAIHELNRLLRVAGNKIDRDKIPSSFITNAEYDLRVVLSWDADNCDMDLWVTDPDGELCTYNHRFTNSGGCLSRDLTGGYGPEEFILPIAKAGEYKVQVHYYGNRQQTVERPTTIQVMLFKNYNKQNEKQDAVTMRLEGVARVVDVGTITVN